MICGVGLSIIRCSHISYGGQSAADREKRRARRDDYHICRCLRLAREVGLSCTGIGARVALYYWPSALIREFIAVFVTRSFLIPALLGWLLFISHILFALAR